MSSINCEGYNANSFSRSLYNNALSPAAREAKIIIPEGIVAKHAVLYGGQISQTQATDSAPKSIIGRVKQKNPTKPSAPEDKAPQTKNHPSEKKHNEEVIDVAPIFKLPQEMLLNMCTFLGLKSLTTFSKTSKDLHQLVSTSPSYQDKVSRESSTRETIRKILEEGRDSDKAKLLTKIAIDQAQDDNIDGAKKTFVLARQSALQLRNNYSKFKALQKIGMAQAENCDIEGAKETFKTAIKALPTQEDYDIFVELKKIAITQARTCGDIEEAKKTADRINCTELKSEVLNEIGLAQLQKGDVAKAKETFAFAREEALLIWDMEQQSSLLARIVNAQIHSDIEEAKETALIIEDTLLKVGALEEIARNQIKNGDITGAKETSAEIESTGHTSSVASVIAQIEASMKTTV